MWEEPYFIKIEGSFCLATHLLFGRDSGSIRTLELLECLPGYIEMPVL